MNWNEPKSHFEGVSFQGYVFLVEPLGEVELRDGRKLPLRAIFRSESNLVSPYLGHGWELPLLESHMVALDERWFRVVEPTGWYRLFWRDEKDPAVLHGQGNWKGVIRGNSISVMADCGDRLDFQDGRLIGMELKGQRLTIERTPDGNAALKQGASTLLAVQRSPLREEIELHVGQNRKLMVGYASRPIIEVVAGQPVVRMQVKSLGSITAEGGTSRRTWDYAVDEKLNTTMTIGKRKIVWSPTTRYALADGEWKYEIKPGEGVRDNAAIGRTNAKGQNEFWHHDKAKGEEIVQGIDGVKKVTSWFTSGKLSGKIRKYETFKNGERTNAHSWIYDDKTRLVRETVDDQIITCAYDEKDRLTRKMSSSGEVLWERVRDNEGRITRTLTNGVLFEYEFLPDGSYRRFQKGPKTENVLRRWAFDKMKRNTEFTSSHGDLFKVVYDELGRKQKLFRNGVLSEIFVFDEESENIVKEIALRPDGKTIHSVRAITTSAEGIKTSSVKLAREMAQNEINEIHNLFIQ